LIIGIFNLEATSLLTAYYLRASEASETLSGVNNGNDI